MTDVSSLKRDADFIKKHLSVVKDGNVKTSHDCYISIPVAFEDKKIVTLGEITQIMGSFAIIMGDKYALFNSLTSYNIKPNVTAIEKINDTPYFKFEFKKGSTFIESLSTIKNGVLAYEILNMYLFRGKVPWYITYDDLAKTFDTAAKHSGLALDANPEILEMLVSLSSRQSSDTSKTLRHLQNNRLSPSDITFVALANIAFGPGTSFTRLLGNYQEGGVITSLTAEDTTTDNVEEVIRS